MDACALRIPIRSSPFSIHSSSNRLRRSVVASSSRFTPVGCMGERERLSAFGTGRRGASESSGCNGYGDEGIDQGITVGEQEGLLAADGMQSTINGMHDAQALWTVCGSVFNATLSVALKRVINQERPVANLRSDPGMPSSHAQSISFVVTFSIVSLIEWIGFNEASLTISGILLTLGVYMVLWCCQSFYLLNSISGDYPIVLWGILLVMFYVSWLRVSQQLHKTDQVIVGGLVGTMSFLFWYILWRAVISRAFDSILAVRVLLVLGAASCCIFFIVYVIRNWQKH